MNEQPLRILEISTLLGVGGITRHVLGLHDWLKARGHKITLAGSPDSWVNHQSGHDFLDLPVRDVSFMGGALPWRIWALARAVWRLRRWLRANPVDVIHAHDSAPALVADLARRGLGVPLVVTYHGSEPERIAAFGRIAARADVVVTPSHRSAEDLATVGHVPRERLKVIGLGVAPPPFVPVDEVADLRRRLIGDGDRLILTLVRLTRQKGVDILIDCVTQLTRDHPTWRFVVAGDGPEENRLKALAQARGLDRVLSFIGRTSTPHLHLRAADLFLLTSRWEALPFTIVEAFQAGCPAVATACSGVVELIDDSVGRVAPIGDVAAISTAVEEVLTDETRRQAMAQAALGRARAPRFDPDTVHAMFDRLYRSLTR